MKDGTGRTGELQRECLWFSVACASIVALAIFLNVYSFYTIDDAYISQRYSRNLAEGHGLTYNPAIPKPVEGYANFLFVVFNAALFKLGLDPIPIVKALCGACAVLCIPLVFLFALWVGAAPAAAAAACWLLAFSTSFSFWAIGGLETTFVALVMLAGSFLFVRERPRTDMAGALLFLLAALCRSEAPVFLIALGLHRAARQLRDGVALRRVIVRNTPWVVLFAAGFCAYFVFRAWYFGALLPNPVYVKTRPVGAPWRLSIAYAFVAGWWPFLAVAFGSLRARQRGAALPLVMTLAAIAVFSVPMRTFAGTVSSQAFYDRYFVPVLPLTIIAVALGLTSLSRLGSIGRVASAVAFVGLATWELLTPRLGPTNALYRAHIGSTVLEPEQAAIADFLNREYPRGVVGLGDIGYIGYRYRGTVLDLYGLTSAEFARRFDRDVSRYMDFVLDQAPNAIVIVYRKANEKEPERAHQYPDYVLIRKSRFLAEYEPTETFGKEKAGQTFYVVYERIDRREPEAGLEPPRDPRPRP